jgi:Protein of unknown function (DUF3551)
LQRLALAFRLAARRLPRVKITFIGLAGAVIVCSAVLFLASTPSRAGIQGDSRWCAVTDTGAENATWDCYYDTIEECRPAVRNRGFCTLNPYWRPGTDKDKD